MAMTQGASFNSRFAVRARHVAGTVGAFIAPPIVATLIIIAVPAEAKSATGTGRVVILTPLSLVKVDDMNFGTIAPTSTAGTIVLNPSSLTCTATGMVVHAGLCQPGSFAGMGVRNMMVRFTLPSTITLTGPGTSMIVDTITLATGAGLVYAPNGNGNGAGNQRWQITANSGIMNFKLGGTLHINANQAAGKYRGTYSVTVQYQ